MHGERAGTDGAATDAAVCERSRSGMRNWENTGCGLTGGGVGPHRRLEADIKANTQRLLRSLKTMWEVSGAVVVSAPEVETRPPGERGVLRAGSGFGSKINGPSGAISASLRD